ncbi:hypothetical protein DICPUDRAFT_99349 [Dictyostelium purpureum]|uniref:Uncharacterized protein n=1 Tax=Dictyostelium purpureum TaxID=5786 RepID=F0ZYE6_DICPU|nr:uncharacterized protein DICPUDRAFT_99349 [Dictyostelium purpureum]EGC31036.1 hypothetical protein DICPUDRAFT_99349 [Dictyostelium purpureum]|eukprot:XP_003292447.1 hypothetical protein DICPUDRAFT_99349 [Dictyostelium purpureum]
MEDIQKDISLLKHKLGSFSAYISSEISGFKNDIEKIEKSIEAQTSKKSKKRTPPKKKDDKEKTDKEKSDKEKADKEKEDIEKEKEREIEIEREREREREREKEKEKEREKEEQIIKANEQREQLMVLDKPPAVEKKRAGRKPGSAKVVTEAPEEPKEAQVTPSKRPSRGKSPTVAEEPKSNKRAKKT